MLFWIHCGMQIRFIHKISVCSRGTFFPKTEQNSISICILTFCFPYIVFFFLRSCVHPFIDWKALNRPWKSAFQHSHVLMRYANYSMARRRLFSFTRTLFIRKQDKCRLFFHPWSGTLDWVFLQTVICDLLSIRIKKSVMSSRQTFGAMDPRTFGHLYPSTLECWMFKTYFSRKFQFSGSLNFFCIFILFLYFFCVLFVREQYC